MKTNSEILAESLKRVLTGKWFGRILIISILLGAVSNLVNRLIAELFVKYEIQTWFDYLRVKIQALMEGVDCAVPSMAVANQMNGATVFQVFITLVFSGITLFGMTAITLKSAKQEDRNWFRDSFAGFARPLGLAWLGFALMFVVTFWSLFLIIPGVIATYRYSQCWNLKVEHPDWLASRCLSESGRIMMGHKFQRFTLDMTFVLGFLMFMLAFVILERFMPLPDFLSTLVEIVAWPLLLILGMWIAVARAVFYKALPANQDADAQTSSAKIESQTSDPLSVSL